ncbi:hypothetical protein K438DRAFT_1747421 [Mycena galopus ATCC 62051]|nr:hypothetical protein K438DRAFT_1747421 [Mycena galopus ATCC 62051]
MYAKTFTLPSCAAPTLFYHSPLSLTADASLGSRVRMRAYAVRPASAFPPILPALHVDTPESDETGVSGESDIKSDTGGTVGRILALARTALALPIQIERPTRGTATSNQMMSCAATSLPPRLKKCVVEESALLASGAWRRGVRASTAWQGPRRMCLAAVPAVAVGPLQRELEGRTSSALLQARMVTAGASRYPVLANPFSVTPGIFEIFFTGNELEHRFRQEVSKTLPQVVPRQSRELHRNKDDLLDWLDTAESGEMGVSGEGDIESDMGGTSGTLNEDPVPTKSACITVNKRKKRTSSESSHRTSSPMPTSHTPTVSSTASCSSGVPTSRIRISFVTGDSTHYLFDDLPAERIAGSLSAAGTCEKHRVGEAYEGAADIEAERAWGV